MKRRLLLSCIALCSVVMGAWAQRGYNFNAVALNVDGLPNSILNININPDGKEEAGATELCGILANSGWDIVGFSEDFNFHSYLVAAPASNYYNFGEHGGKVSSTSNSTDGLGFACNKRFSMSGGDRTKWTSLYGGSGLLNVGDNGADGMIDKGFRIYTVTLATGVAVDVYVLHMDANTADSDDDYDSNGRDKNVVAREAQLKQLADYVVSKMKTNKRPVIILGDTNCRYTREAVKTGFIDYIETDSRFTVKDAWVELMWSGTYPTYGGSDMTTGQYGDQKGEVVDKVFYINTTDSELTLKANSYLHDTSVKTSDHYPVVVNFTLTDPNGKALTDVEKEGNWSLEESVATFEKPTWEGEQVVSGTDYYLMNVGTNEYLRVGGAYYTEGISGNAALKITPTTTNGGTTWVLNTYRSKSLGTGEVAYTDQSGEWYLEPVDGTAYQYRLKNTGGTYLTATTENEHPVLNSAGNASDENQKWVFLTDARIRTEMSKANADYPFNFTALLKSAEFDVIEVEDGWTAQGWSGFDHTNGPFKGSFHNWGWDAMQYSSYAYANQQAAATMSQSVGTLPNGIYDISFTGFYRSRTSSADETISAVVKFGSTSISVPQNKNTNIGDNGAACEFFKVNNTIYRTKKQITLNSSQSVTVTVTKPKSSSEGWICVDNFQLLYYGTSAEAVDPYKDYKETVRAKVNGTYAKVLALNQAGQASYDIYTVISRYDADKITNADEAQLLCDMVDVAYANAYAAHRAYIVEDAFNNMGADGDVSAAIDNRSFETGDLTGWTVFRNARDTRVANNLNATGMDGSYLFNTWDDGDYGCGIIYQDVKNIRNGYYTLQAMVTSWADRKVYIMGNNQYTGAYSPSGEGTFVNLSLDFLVEKGVAQIGAVGGNEGNDFYYKQGIFYKVDNFRLTYKGTVGEGRVKIALADAKAKAANLNPTSKAQFDKAVAQYENASVNGDGKTEEAAIYDALKAAIASQPYAETDMTWLITNPGFEAGDWAGWTKPTAWDAVVLHATHNNAPANGEEQYVVNVWNDHADATNSGVNAPVYQTLSGLPNGRYRLTADVASDGGNKVCAYATVGGQTVNGAASPANNWTFVEANVEFAVTDNADVTIGAVGLREGEFNIEGGCWYKCDNFRLTYLGHEGEFSETTDNSGIDDWYTSVILNRTIKPGKWSTFVVPFDIPASSLSGWEVKELESSTLSGDKITLVFADAADGIKAGVPYMVRNMTMGENLTQINMENIQVNTTLDTPSTSHVEFVGTYQRMNIPQGAFFISDNVFYQAADNTNTIKAFRAYFTTKSANARSLSYRFAGNNYDDDDETTSIDNGQLTNGNEVTTVAIYNERGMRLTEMQQGINILQMSDGSVVKVVIK